MNSTFPAKKFTPAVLGLLFLAVPSFAQEFRGSISGRVLDPSGAGIAGAQVVVTNTEENVSATTTTDAAGEYQVLYLNPGQYRITVTVSGFKTLERRGIEVRVGDKLAVDLRLEMGTVAEQVTVSGAQPLLETEDASHGTVVDNIRLRDLPLQDGNPIMLTRLAAGVTPTGSFGPFNRPFDSYGPSSIRVEGAPGANEYTLNGLPDMSLHNTVGFSPPTDAVQQSKTVNDSYNAQTGHTGAAIIDQALKSGTNQLHGTLYEFSRNDFFNANDFFRNRAHLPTSKVRYNRFGGSVGGPAIIPKLYDGRDKTFFFFAVELFRYTLPDNFGNNFTMPTQAERNGDLQDIAAAIYDPFAGTPGSGGTVVRQQMCIQVGGVCQPGTLNKIDPSRISPIAQAYMKFMPLPNLPGVQNNYVPSPIDTGPFDSIVFRVDHTLSSKQKLFGHYIRNRWDQRRGGWTAPVNGVQPDGQNFFRNNDGAEFGDTYAFSASKMLDLRVGYGRFLENSLPTSLNKFDPATMGFSSATIAQFLGYKYVPTLNINSYLGANSGSLTGNYFGGSLGKSDGGPTTFNVVSFQPTMTWITHNHTFQFGWDFRNYRINSSGPGDVIGHYQFGGEFANASSTSSTQFGQAFAQFLLGLPSGSSSIDRNVAGSSYQTLYNALFLQDNIHVTPKLTVNVGVRYELESPLTERFNRNVRGFDFTDPNPIESQAIANYTAIYSTTTPTLPLPPNNFRVLGGELFASSARRGIWNSDKGNLEPRVGFAYQFAPRTVLRAGWGLHLIPYFSAAQDYSDGRNQAGFSQSTNVIPTNDNGLTFNPNSSCTLNCWADPFSNGIATPVGASLGLGTFLGQGLSTVVPLNRKHGLVQHWSVEIQRELPGQWLLDVGYFATHGSRLLTTRTLETVPRQYLSTLPTRDDATITYLNRIVPNPFLGLIPGQSLGTSSTVQLRQLLLPYPEFTGLSVENYNGISDFQSGQATLQKRFSGGFTLQAAYTWSKLLEQVSYLNATDANLEKRVSNNNVPQQIAVSGIWVLPIGRRQLLGGSWPVAMQEVLGGWQLGVSYRVQSGFPIGLGNLYFNGDLRALHTNVSSATVGTVFDKSPFYIGGVVNPNDTNIKLADNIRTMPSMVSWFRGDALNNWDASLMKIVSIRERVRLQVRLEAFNVFNKTLFSNPNMDTTSRSFGSISGVSNAPRYLQLGAKLIF